MKTLRNWGAGPAPAGGGARVSYGRTEPESQEAFPLRRKSAHLSLSAVVNPLLSRFFLSAFLLAAGRTGLIAAEKSAAACSCEMVSGYLDISEALASDDFKQAKTAAVALVKEAQADGMLSIVKAAKAVADARDIAQARQALRTLTSEVAPMADAKTDVVMYCPMAKADWIQARGPTRNPYFGKAMLDCGAPKKSS